MAHKYQTILDMLSPLLRLGNYSEDMINIPVYCPFHKSGGENVPSMYLYLGPRVYRGNKKRPSTPGDTMCHQCGRGWSLHSLLRDIGGDRRLVDAIRKIAEQENVGHVVRRRYEVDLDNPILPEALLGYYDLCPKNLLREGFCKNTLRHFDVGFDRIEKRITFPLRRHTGELTGISGRTVVGHPIRYKIYKGAFNRIVSGYEVKKSRLLWGLDSFYLTALNYSLDYPVILCEGFKAGMWIHQSGFRNVCCPLGTSMSETQVALLTRITNKIIVFHDNDAPGRRACKDRVRVLSDIVDVYVARYPDGSRGLSPDDLSLSQVRDAINNAQRHNVWSFNNGGSDV
jgi:5S rRNA maturation endonuclease (ribonuclease M5)